MKTLLIVVLFVITSSLLFSKQIVEDNMVSEKRSYKSIEVSIKNEVDDINLTGTLSVPIGVRNFHTVILVSGSGAFNRDSEIVGHKPFYEISNYLSNNGIGVLRLDDRGIGQSEGNYNTSSINDLTRDIEYSIEYLKTLEMIDSTKIGLLGHSLGGLITMKICSERNDIEFLILLASPGIKGAELMLMQKELIERKMGVNEETISSGKEVMKQAYGIINSSNNLISCKSDLQDFFLQKYSSDITKNQISRIVNTLCLPWFYDFIRSNPNIYLSKINCPVLVLSGNKDLQVPSKINCSAIKNILESNKNEKVEIMEFNNLNHLFLECETGLPQEYQTLQGKFSKSVLEKITSWLFTLNTN